MPNKNYKINQGLPKGILTSLRTKVSNIKKCVKLKTVQGAKKYNNNFKLIKTTNLN